MGSAESVYLISSLAIALSKDKTVEEIELISVMISQLGDTLATIATQKAMEQGKYQPLTPQDFIVNE